jgi:hypothetical protein
MSSTTDAWAMPSEASSVADFHEQRRSQPPRHGDALAAPKHGELRRRNAMKRQQLLAQHLVARQQQAARIAAGIGCAHQLQERDHVLVVGDDAVELLQQIEHQLRLALHQRGTQFRQRIEHAERLHLVAGGAQRGDHVVFGAPFVDLLLRRTLQGCRAAPGSSAPPPAYAVFSCAQAQSLAAHVQPHHPPQHDPGGAQ